MDLHAYVVHTTYSGVQKPLQICFPEKEDSFFNKCSFHYSLLHQGNDQTCQIIELSKYVNVRIVCITLFTLRGMDTLSGEITLSELFYLHFEQGSTLKRKNLLPME